MLPTHINYIQDLTTLVPKLSFKKHSCVLFTAVIDLCKQQNGGCARGAKCVQKGVKVTCTCPTGHQGDGFVCTPINLCANDDGGGCHEHATCTMTDPVKATRSHPGFFAGQHHAVSFWDRRGDQKQGNSHLHILQGKRKCECKSGYIGDGIDCEVRELPINRCALDNGQCHMDAVCTDLHYEGELCLPAPLPAVHVGKAVTCQASIILSHIRFSTRERGICL